MPRLQATGALSPRLRLRRPWLCVGLVLAVAACRNSAPASPVSSAPVANSQAGIDSALGRARLLAFLDPQEHTRVDEEIRGAQESSRRQPQKIDFLLTLGRNWVRKARETAQPALYLNANAAAELALELEPDNRLALALQGLVLLNDHRFAEALALAKRILARTPEDTMGLGVLSDAALELGRYDEATVAAQRMVDLKPNLPSYSRASWLRWLRGDIEGAKDAVRLAMGAGVDTRDLEPHAWVVVQAATIFWNQNDLEGAEAGFARALSEVPDYPPALVGRARLLLARGDAKTAAVLLARANDKSPLVSTLWLLGDARAAAGDAAGANEAWALVEKRGLTGDPRTLADFLATKDRSPELALKLAAEEREVRDDLWTEDVYAWALYRAGRFAEARAASDKALVLGTPDPRLLYRAGAIRLAQGVKDKGRALIARALALNPRFDETGALEAKKLLGGGRLARQQ